TSPAARCAEPKAPRAASYTTGWDTIDKFAVVLAREGEDAMRKKLRPVEDGLVVTRPLEVVMIDEHTLDLIAFFEQNDWREKFTDEQWDQRIRPA
ncbi:hypothetical protein, partial [uncultured Jannaschia sp.]|uniref:hypothetical protein n=1 Tax=uncultured Jannaschia sp. TaxID=293347 RepID=UPI00262C73B1